MRGHHSFDNLKDSLSPESQERVQKKIKNLHQEMALAEVRQAMPLTQEELAGMLYLKQAAVARLENRTDMYISSLRKYIGALGGKLDIVARFSDGNIHIQKLQDLHL